MTDQPGLWIEDASHRHDLSVFAERARSIDDAAVVRLRMRSDGLLGAWVATGFDVLAARVVAGTVRPSDMTCAADQLATGLRSGQAHVETGYPMDSAWRGALPPETGFVHLDDVPAAVVADLARSGADLAREHGGHGPPASLLEQEVLHVSGGGDAVAVPMRCVLALAAMRFIPENPGADEVIRVRTSPSWLRIDARYGSVAGRRNDFAVTVR